MEIISRLEALYYGLRYRRALALDYAGLPPWLIKRICPSSKGWGTLLYILTEALDIDGIRGDDDDQDEIGP